MSHLCCNSIEYSNQVMVMATDLWWLIYRYIACNSLNLDVLKSIFMWLLSIDVHLLSKHNQEGGKAVKNLINLTIHSVLFQVERLGTWASNKYLHTVIVNNYNFTANILEDQTGKQNCKILINIIFSVVLTNAGINVLIPRISSMFGTVTFTLVSMSNFPC